MGPAARKPLIRPERYGFFDRLLFAVLVLLVPPLLAGTRGLFRDGDVSWHVAAGQWILVNGRVPDTDPFSYTMAGQPWVAHEWLAEIIYALAFNAWGYAGLAAVVTVALMALHLSVFLHLRSRIGPVAILLAFVAMDAILLKFLWARPHVLVWPLLAMWTASLLNARDEGRAPHPALALLMLVWTNLHGSFALGLIVAGSIAFDALAKEGWRRPLFIGWLNFGLLAILAALLNVNGSDGLLHPFTIMGLEALHVIQEWAPSAPATSLPFYFGLLAVLAIIALKGVRLAVGETALLLLLLAMAFLQVRHQSWLVIVASLMLTPRLSASLRGEAPAVFATDRERRIWASGALAIAGALVALRLLVPLQPKDNSGAPGRLIAAIPAELRSQPVLNEYSFGGPLILAGIRPYIDGRADMYGDAFTFEHNAIVNGDMTAFRRAVSRWRIGWTILSPDTPLARRLDREAGWRRLYRDHWAVVHVAR